MSIRFPLKSRTLAVMTILVLTLAACSPFGSAQATETPTTEPTATSLPTNTPAPTKDLATPTPTLTPELATPTATVTHTPPPTPTEEPTGTPTVEATKEDEGEGQTKTTTAGTLPAAKTVAGPPEIGDLVLNGSFEDGFSEEGVALEWTALSTSKAGAVYGWEDETRGENISHGEHAQLMRIMGPAKWDQFIGVYQTFTIVPSETYTLTMHGLIRSSLANDDYDPLAFRYHWAVADGGGTDWTAVEWKDWTELGWNDVRLDAKYPTMNAYVIHFTPQGDTVTLFIRGWSKWPVFRDEVKFYIDGVSVVGPLPAASRAGGAAQPEAEMPTTGGGSGWLVPIAGVILVLGLALWEVRKNWAR